MPQELIEATEIPIKEGVQSIDCSLTAYLNQLSLPSEGVLVTTNERGRVFLNVPPIIEQIPALRLPQATYISKFLAACGVGLFDAALNYLWDETVKSLRDKVAHFDLEYFYDSVVTNPERRSKLNGPDDLAELDDWELIRGCHTTGILSSVGFMHLDYIRNMRNWASAAHPNQNKLTGLQLVSWLETCIREVIGTEPSGPVITIKRLLHNIRQTPLTSADVGPIAENIKLLPPDLNTSLLRTIFGMFVDPKISPEVKNSIRLIAPSAWINAPEETKQECGLKRVVFAANGDIAKRDAAMDFLQVVDGLSYLPEDALAVEISEKVSNLYNAHVGYHNFYNEPAHAHALFSLIPTNGIVPDAVRYQYVKTITMCYIGNGYGVSIVAYDYYQSLVARFQDKEIQVTCQLPADSEVGSRLQFESCKRQFRTMIDYLKNRTSNEKTIRCIDFLLSRNDDQLPSVGSVSEYKRLAGIK